MGCAPHINLNALTIPKEEWAYGMGGRVIIFIKNKLILMVKLPTMVTALPQT